MNATPPHEAKNRYLKDKSTDVTDSNLSNYETTLNVFCGYLTDEAGADTLNTLTSDEIHDNQEDIEAELGNPDLKDLATEISENDLIEALAPYVSNQEAVAESVREEANIWNDQIYD